MPARPGRHAAIFCRTLYCAGRRLMPVLLRVVLLAAVLTRGGAGLAMTPHAMAHHAMAPGPATACAGMAMAGDGAGRAMASDRVLARQHEGGHRVPGHPDACCHGCGAANLALLTVGAPQRVSFVVVRLARVRDIPSLAGRGVQRLDRPPRLRA